jgi:hypothetical protein
MQIEDGMATPLVATENIARILAGKTIRSAEFDGDVLVLDLGDGAGAEIGVQVSGYYDEDGIKMSYRADA